MTNVPQTIRDLWTDIYVLFDKHYLMPNTEEAWNGFWNQAMRVQMKHKDIDYTFNMISLVVDIISNRMKDEAAKEYKRPCTLEDMKLF